MPADDRFEFERLVGDGPRARVWLARDRTDGGRVALKEFRAAHDPGGAWRQALLEQIDAVHPGLAAIHGEAAGGEDGRPRIVREFVDGRTPADLVRAEGPQALLVPAAEALRVLDGLAALDRAHGGLAPGNLLVRDRPRAAYRLAVLDGGALSATTATHLPYLAPERLAGAPPTIAADVYALGVVLFEALHGRPPYRVRNGGAEAWAAAIGSGRRIRPGVPPPLPAALTAWLETLIEANAAARPTPRAALAQLGALAGAQLECETATGASARLAALAPRLRGGASRALWEQLAPSRDPRLVFLCGAAAEDRERLLRGVAREAAGRGWRVTFPPATADLATAIAAHLDPDDDDHGRGRLLILPRFDRAGGAAVPALLQALRGDRDPAVRVVAGVAAARPADGRLGRLIERAGRGPSLRRVDLAPLDAAAIATLVRGCGSALDAGEVLRRTAGDADRVAAALIAGDAAADLPEAACRLRAELSPGTLRWLAGDTAESAEAIAAALAAGLAFRLDGRARRASGPLLDAVIEPTQAATIEDHERRGEGRHGDTTLPAESGGPVGPPPASSGLETGLAAVAAASHAETEERLRRDLAAAGDDLEVEVRTGIALAAVRLVAGRHGDAIAAARDAANLAARLGDLDALAEARAVQAVAAGRCGRTAEALRLLDLPHERLDPAALETLRLATIEVRSAGARPDQLALLRELRESAAPALERTPQRRAWRETLELECLARAGDDGFTAADAAWRDAATAGSACDAPHWRVRADLAALVARTRAKGARDAAAATVAAARALYDRVRDTWPGLAAEAAALGVDALRSAHRPREAQELAAVGRRTLDVAAERVGDAALRAGFLERGAFTALREGAAGARRRLHALYEMSRALNSESDPEALLESILDMALEVVSAERGMILLRGADGELTVRLARNLERQTVADAERFSRNVALQAGAGRPVLAVDTGTDARVRDFKSVSLFGIRSVLCVPLRSRGEIVGVVYLDSRVEGAPFSADDLEFLEAFADHAALALENARARRRLEQDNERLQVAAEARAHFGNIVGESAAMGEVFALIEKFAASDLPVLVQGESGTGKELVARAVHFNSERRKRTFVTENCAAIPESLLQSELFGHVRGAFTGADRDRAGLFEQADGGTLFLDEVGDMPPGMQAQLLRVLQEGEVRRVGSDRLTRVDVRVIAATHRDLQAEADAGGFRVDLLYRLQVLSVQVPPLRERDGDVALLVGHFVARIARERGRAAPAIDPAFLELLRVYRWPGNVRQLENVLQRLSLLAGDGPLTAELVRQDGWLARIFGGGAAPAAPAGTLAVSERERIGAALAASGGNRARAARLLGISRATIYRKIAELEL